MGTRAIHEGTLKKITGVYSRPLFLAFCSGSVICLQGETLVVTLLLFSTLTLQSPLLPCAPGIYGAWRLSRLS